MRNHVFAVTLKNGGEGETKGHQHWTCSLAITFPLILIIPIILTENNIYEAYSHAILILNIIL
jgi:hypothetical protein